MQGSGKIREAIKRMSRETAERVVFATVTEYNEPEGTVSALPIDGTAGLSDIKLRPETSAPGVFMVPEIGSIIAVAMVNDSEGFVSMFSEVSSVVIKTTSGNVVQFQDGSFGGLIIISDLITKLNTVENDLNSLKSALSGWVPIASDGGAALKTALASYYAATITPTVAGDIENDLITHGT